MSRTGVTYDDVAKAALCIESRGELATIEKVRLELGETGSNTTISKHLQRWRRRPASEKLESQAPTPAIVQRAVDHVWTEIKNQTSAEVEAIKEETQKVVEEAETKALAAVERFNSLQAEHLQLIENYHIQSAEKESLNLEFKKLQQEHVLLQERLKALEDKHVEMQKAVARHLNDLTTAHKDEVGRLEEAGKLLTENHASAIKEIINQYQEEQAQLTVLLDMEKVENKRLNEFGLELRAQLQEKAIKIAELEANLKAVILDRDKTEERLLEQDKRLINFNNKTLIPDDILEKIYDAPKLEQLTYQIKSTLTKSIHDQLHETINEIKQLIKAKKKIYIE